MWRRRTRKYEAAVSRKLVELGLRAVWRPVWSQARQAELDAARAEAAARGEAFDGRAFVARKRREERKAAAAGRGGARAADPESGGPGAESSESP